MPPSITIGNKRIAITCGDENGVKSDFIGVFLDDTYRLQNVAESDPTIRTIVDIGTNLGWFALAARDYFPVASIELYEPNQEIRAALTQNTLPIGAICHHEAVGGQADMVRLEVGSESNQGRTFSGGSIVQVALQDVLVRAGGCIDLLKLDCEGAEWQMFESRDAWSAIRWVTMEYHLWARPLSTHASPVDALHHLGFKVLGQQCDSAWGTLVAVNERWLNERRSRIDAASFA